MSEDAYEVLAVRYGTFAGRHVRDSLLRAELHADAPYPLDFYLWVIRNAHRTNVVDTGFDPAEAARRNRTLIHEPRDALAIAGVDAAWVRDVIVTHMHFDHAGGITQFPAATFHLREAEMEFATGRYMAHSHFAHPFGVEVTCDMVRAVYRGRVAFHDGTAEIAPNLTVHRVGAHRPGVDGARLRRGAPLPEPAGGNRGQRAETGCTPVTAGPAGTRPGIVSEPEPKGITISSALPCITCCSWAKSLLPGIKGKHRSG